MSELTHLENMPILALRGMTVFPGQTVHFDIGRMKSALAVEYAMKHDQTLIGFGKGHENRSAYFACPAKRCS